MISGEVIWCSICGAYADLSVGGLQEACKGKHTGPWKGGGRRGQLCLLRKNVHPKTRIQLPPPIAEATMTLDAAATASRDEQVEAARQSTRYSAKDKAIARSNATDPRAALTDEKRQWIAVKRAEAQRKAADRLAQRSLPHGKQAADDGTTSADKRAAFEVRIRAKVAAKRPPSEDLEHPGNGQH